jgi:hypothetical protein
LSYVNNENIVGGRLLGGDWLLASKVSAAIFCDVECGRFSRIIRRHKPHQLLVSVERVAVNSLPTYHENLTVIFQDIMPVFNVVH